MQKSLLSLKNIEKQYHNKNGTTTHALKKISFDIHQGEVFGLLGPNGAGKTTLSSLIATLHPPTAGDILFDGKSIYSDIYRYRFSLGYCQQYPNLDGCLTLEENLRYAGKMYGMSNAAVSERLTILIDTLQLGPYLKRSSTELSGGYKQRFMIARSLIHSPKLVIFDEPTVGLDPHIRRQLWDLINNLKHLGITVLLTTHYLDEAEYLADRVCILSNGEIKLIDTPERLMSDLKQKSLEEVYLALMKE